MNTTLECAAEISDARVSVSNSNNELNEMDGSIKHTTLHQRTGGRDTRASQPPQVKKKLETDRRNAWHDLSL